MQRPIGVLGQPGVIRVGAELGEQLCDARLGGLEIHLTPHLP